MPTSKRALMTEMAPRPVARLPELPRVVPMFRAPAAFGVSRSTIYRAANAGDIRLVKLGRSTLVDSESVLAWLANLPTITPKAVA